MPRNALSVFASGQHSGLISRSEREQQTYLFTYDPGAPDDAAVSLTMPVQADQYDSVGTIHPIFEMNLPEGQLRHKLELMFSKAIRDFDSLSLLEIIGKSQLGRLRYTTEGNLPEEVPAESIGKLLAYKGTEDLFDALLERFAQYSGVSGMQPKVLVRDAAAALDRITDKSATHIVKSFNPREYPELAANEFFSMRAAACAGLPTADVSLSANRSMLVVARFDRTEQGGYLGFEDFCVLSGLRSAGRYNSSYEALANKVAAFVSPEHSLQAMAQLFGMIVLACAIRNGDAHLKNFAILYDRPGDNVRLAPVYDMLSTTPYNPRDVLALELNGTKRFPERKALLQFALQSCGLNRRRAESIMARVAHGVQEAIADMESYASRNPDFEQPARHFTRVFAQGLASL